jgi:hypothetical protein
MLTMYIAQLGGLTLGLSVGGAVFVNVASKNLYHILPNTPRDQVQQMVSGTSGHLLKSLSSDVRRKVLEVIVSAWNDVYLSTPSFPVILNHRLMAHTGSRVSTLGLRLVFCVPYFYRTRGPMCQPRPAELEGLRGIRLDRMLYIAPTLTDPVNIWADME